MWEISISSQLNSVVTALLFGLFLAVQYFAIYEFIAKPKRETAVFISDILFWIFTSIEYFLLNLAFSNGKIRFILIIISTAGFLIFYKSIGFVRISFRFIQTKFSSIYKFLLFSIQVLMHNCNNMAEKFFFLLKKLLIKCAKMMYNVFVKNKCRGCD